MNQPTLLDQVKKRIAERRANLQKEVRDLVRGERFNKANNLGCRILGLEEVLKIIEGVEKCPTDISQPNKSPACIKLPGDVSSNGYRLGNYLLKR